MRIGVLGPLELVVDDGAVPVSGRRLRIVLAVLALDAPRPVSVERLADIVWDGDPPAGARNALQTLVSRARRMLGEAGVADPSARLSQSPAGYSLAMARSAWARSASARCVTGLIFTNACSQPGSVPVSAKTLLPKVNGNRMPCTDPAVRAFIPIHTDSHPRHSAKRIASRHPATAAAGFVRMRKPMAYPAPSSTTVRIA